MEDGRVISVEGLSDHPVNKGRLCSKGYSAVDLLYSEDRVKAPMVKKEKAWSQVSWDEALSYVASRLKAISFNYGPESLAVYCGEALGHQVTKQLVARFCDVFGTPNFCSVDCECHTARDMANILTYGGFPSPDYENSRCILIWGANPYASHLFDVDRIRRARESGATLIVVDPRKTRIASEADLFLQLRPGTDGALALAMLNVIFTEGLYDPNIVDRSTGFWQLLARAGEFTPEVAERITWVRRQLISEAARTYATRKPGCIEQGNALDHHSNAVQTVRAIASLVALTGNLDVKGGNLFRYAPRLNSLRIQGERSSATKRVGEKEHPLYCEIHGEAQAILLPDAILEGKPYPVKALIVAGGNPLLQWPNSRKVEEALRRLELLVVIDLFMNEVARLADVFLPAATYLERDEIHYYPSLRRIAARRKLVGVPEAWPDMKIWLHLARIMGYEADFPWKEPRDVLDFVLSPSGVDLDELERSGAGVEYSVVPCGGRGGIEFYSERLLKAGFDPLPSYEEPVEGPANAALYAKYPLILTSGARIPVYVHSRLRNIERLRKLEPEPYVEINPETARGFGVVDGELVEVSSPRGSIRIRAKVTDSILRGVVNIANGWSEANVNMLTDDLARDPISGFPSLKSQLCTIRKL
jgi:anaerobic selenocysteine-containing dehydrogenase